MISVPINTLDRPRCPVIAGSPTVWCLSLALLSCKDPAPSFCGCIPGADLSLVHQEGPTVPVQEGVHIRHVCTSLSTCTLPFRSSIGQRLLPAFATFHLLVPPSLPSRFRTCSKLTIGRAQVPGCLCRSESSTLPRRYGRRDTDLGQRANGWGPANIRHVELPDCPTHTDDPQCGSRLPGKTTDQYHLPDVWRSALQTRPVCRDCSPSSDPQPAFPPCHAPTRRRIALHMQLACP